MRRPELDQYQRDTVAVGLVPWLCLLTLLVVLTGTLVGWAQAAVVAVIFFTAGVAACFVFCTIRLARRLRIAGRRSTPTTAEVDVPRTAVRRSD